MHRTSSLVTTTSVISSKAVESLDSDDEDTWERIRNELMDIGITIAAIEENKKFIMGRIQSALASGAFEEDPNEIDWANAHLERTSNHTEESHDKKWEDHLALEATSELGTRSSTSITAVESSRTPRTDVLATLSQNTISQSPPEMVKPRTFNLQSD